MKHGFLFWVSLLFVSVVMASFTISSNCYAAAVTSSMVDDINEKCNKVFEYYGYTYRNVFPYNISIGYNPNIPKMCIGITTSDSPIKPNYLYVFYPDQEPMTLSGNNYTTWFYQIVNLNNGNREGLSGYSINKTIKWKYIYTEFNWSSTTGYDFQANNEYGASILLKPPIINLEFNNNLENTAYNGNLFTYYYQGDFYSNSQIKLGDVIPNDSYYFEIRLKDSRSLNIKGTSFVALNTDPYNIYNDGAIYINNNFEVYAIPRLLSYSTQYQLEITSYYGDGDNNLSEDIDWFIFLPNNAVVSGDEITSLGSGDFTQQDNTNTMIGFLNNNGSPSGDLQAILDTSGNILSGDLFKDIKMPQIDGMNKRTLFDLLYAIAGTLGESGDAYFDFQMHGETPTRIYASQFRTPDGPLKTLISSFLVFLTFYFLLSQFRHTIEMLSTANVKGAIEYVDTSLDNMFYM